MRDAVAGALVRAGRWTRDRHFVLADAAMGHLAIGRFLHRRGLPLPRVVATRRELFDIAAEGSARAHGALLYVELGVHEGESIRYWADRVADPNARFVGFDSFEGLPEQWNEGAGRGHFSTGGRAPAVEDPRVSFVAGWFEDTLPRFDPPGNAALVVAFDADLYSSTITGLRALRPHLRPGTWLYFDELNDRHHELRALDEFLDESQIRVEVVAAARNRRHWLFRVAA